MDSPIRIGISSCLLGNKVRYDGGHKLDPYIVRTLGKFFTWVAVCPEVESGMGTPRPALHLAGDPHAPRLVVTSTDDDVTDRMQQWSAARLEELASWRLHGYILKRASPSCGMERVPVRGDVHKQRGRGLFAQALMTRFPLLPVEEEGRLQDMGLRENFVERVFAYQRWMQFVDSSPARGDLVEFHTRHKLTLLSHSRKLYTELGRLVADCGRKSRGAVLDTYGQIFMQALSRLATRAKHTDVLLHALGHFKKVLDSGDRQELVARIEEYRGGTIPLIVPLTLLSHHLRRADIPWLVAQTYLQPYPAELSLRHHV